MTKKVRTRSYIFMGSKRSESVWHDINKLAAKFGNSLSLDILTKIMDACAQFEYRMHIRLDRLEQQIAKKGKQ